MDEALGRILALDYGRARIGVAVADELGILASPRPFVPARPPQRALRQLVQLVRAEQVRLILVGLPLNMDGTEGASAARARKFGHEVARECRVSVEFLDERLSTVWAQALLHEAGRSTRDSRQRIDSASAAILLQGYLDSRRAR